LPLSVSFGYVPLFTPPLHDPFLSSFLSKFAFTYPPKPQVSTKSNCLTPGLSKLISFLPFSSLNDPPFFSVLRNIQYPSAPLGSGPPSSPFCRLVFLVPYAFFFLSIYPLKLGCHSNSTSLDFPCSAPKFPPPSFRLPFLFGSHKKRYQRLSSSFPPSPGF